MIKNLLVIIALSFMAFGANSQQIDNSKIKCFMAFEDNLNDGSDNSVTFSLTQGDPLIYEAGKFGNAGKFVSNSVLSSGLGFNPGDGFTICAWINLYQLPSVNDRGCTYIHQLNDGTVAGRIHLEVVNGADPDLRNYIGSFTDGARCDNTVSAVADTWYHVAHVRNADGSRILYVDGVQVTTTEAPAALETNNSEIVLGSNKQQNGAWAYGYMDDLIITTEILTPTQIAYIKNNGVAQAMSGTNDIYDVETLGGINAYCVNNQLAIDNNSSATEAIVKVYTLAGKQIIAKDMDLVAGKSMVDFNVEKGIYLVQIQINEEVKTVKVIKK